MRSTTMRRHLGPAAAPGMLKALLAEQPMPDEFTARDRAAYLLHVDAEIEHCLMVQYLYAAYSLGGPQVPEQHRHMVRGWQEIILGIAKEEMGHLVAVQNALRLIGAPLNFGRADFPWDTPFYPFPFALEALTLDSLAKYVYAESPVGWSGPLAEEIRARVDKATPTPHTVSQLFAVLLPLVKDPARIPDSAFQASTVPFQADFAEWGRGYVDGQRGNSSGAHPPKTPNVIVQPLASRDDAVAALQQIAEQGEAPSESAGSEPSHFARFLRIYQEMKQFDGQGWTPSRKVATNPYVSLDPELDMAGESSSGIAASRIKGREAVLWAQLHNVRYRMLLAYLQHSFLLDGGAIAAGAFSPRGAIINATFGEMYNLRALSEILMQLPLDQHHPELGLAGPPFQTPYTLDPPFGEPNRWRLHLDLLQVSGDLLQALEGAAPPERQAYIATMRSTDRKMQQTAQRIIEHSVDLALTN